MHTLYLGTKEQKVNRAQIAKGCLYAHHKRLSEPPRGEIDEAFVQRLWFEEAFSRILTTDTGGKIEIIQTGFWNHRGGPDFLRAALLNERGEKETGAIEIHLSPADWHQHAHADDPNYADVILHVVWKDGGKTFYPKTSQHRSIRQVELSSQVKLPLDELRLSFHTTPQERTVGARPGPCADEMAEMTESQAIRFLTEAGWHRFHLKRNLWQTRVHLLGQEQALWLGLSETLGYSENKVPFRMLAQHFPIRSLVAEESVEAEAMIFGAAGFLPDMVLARDDHDAATYQRFLWDRWWQKRAGMLEKIVPRDLWKTGGIRPPNRPERRLAVLALLARRKKWSGFVECSMGHSPERLEEWLSRLSHPFWDSHYSFHSRSPEKVSLLGASRIRSLLYNVILPIRAMDAETESWLESAPATNQHLSAKIAATRLLPRHPSLIQPQTLLVQEGLVQIYQDFCLANDDHCENCSMPHEIRLFPSKLSK